MKERVWNCVEVTAVEEKRQWHVATADMLRGAVWRRQSSSSWSIDERRKK
jgi:hypothetical protein